MNELHFDVLIEGDFAYRTDRDLPVVERLSLVRHLDADGTMFAAHTPLDRGPIHCTFCETPGNRVYMTIEDDT